MNTPSSVQVLHDMQRWLERAVIGLNLCPFAKSVYVKGQVHWSISSATDPEALLADLERELSTLHSTPSELRDTTVLVVPHMLSDFLDYNDFLDRADEALESLGLSGVLQIASFHPQYQFAGTDPDDVTNYTNRAPYPALHLLREDSISRAVEAFPNAEEIFERNMERLQALGTQGWDALDVGPHSKKADE